MFLEYLYYCIFIRMVNKLHRSADLLGVFSDNWTEELKEVDTVPAVNSHEICGSWLLPVKPCTHSECTLLWQDEVSQGYWTSNIAPKCIGNSSVTRHLNRANTSDLWWDRSDASVRKTIKHLWHQHWNQNANIQQISFQINKKKKTEENLKMSTLFKAHNTL